MKRLNKSLKWFGIVSGTFLLTLVLVNAWFIWTTDARLEAQLAAIREAGDPLTLADLARPPIPSEQNAATYLDRAQPEMQMMESQLRPYYNWHERHKNDVMPPAIQRIVQAAFDAHPKVIPLMEQAAACSDYDAQLDYSIPVQEFTETQVFAPMQTSRRSARILEARAGLLTSEDKLDEAVRTSLIAFRLAGHFDHNPTLACYLMANLVRTVAINSANMALQSGPVSPEVRTALEAELANQERMTAYAWALKSERVMMRSTFFQPIPGRSLWFCRGFWNRQDSQVLDGLQAGITAVSDPGSLQQKATALEELETQTSNIARQVFPLVRVALQVPTRVRAEIRCLRVLNALQTHLLVENDAVPKLSELGLPVVTTMDPFTGQPLHIKRLPIGWLIYSVGRNFQDDGGDLENAFNGDPGIGPALPSEMPSNQGLGDASNQNSWL